MSACIFLSCPGVRHPEELSLMRKMDRESLKRNQGVSATRRTQIPGMVASPNGHAPVNSSYDSGTGTLGSPYRTASTPQVYGHYRSADFHLLRLTLLLVKHPTVVCVYSANPLSP